MQVCYANAGGRAAGGTTAAARAPSAVPLPACPAVGALAATHLSASSLNRPAACCTRSWGSAAQVGPRPRGIFGCRQLPAHGTGYSGMRGGGLQRGHLTDVGVQVYRRGASAIARFLLNAERKSTVTSSLLPLAGSRLVVLAFTEGMQMVMNQMQAGTCRTGAGWVQVGCCLGAGGLGPAHWQGGGLGGARQLTTRWSSDRGTAGPAQPSRTQIGR